MCQTSGKHLQFSLVSLPLKLNLVMRTWAHTLNHCSRRFELFAIYTNKILIRTIEWMASCCMLNRWIHIDMNARLIEKFLTVLYHRSLAIVAKWKWMFMWNNDGDIWIWYRFDRQSKWARSEARQKWKRSAKLIFQTNFQHIGSATNNSLCLLASRLAWKWENNHSELWIMEKWSLNFI